MAGYAQGNCATSESNCHVGQSWNHSFRLFFQGCVCRSTVDRVAVVPERIETATDIERVIENTARLPNSSLMLPPDATTIVQHDLIVGLAAKHRLPAVYPMSIFVTAGG